MVAAITALTTLRRSSSTRRRPSIATGRTSRLVTAYSSDRWLRRGSCGCTQRLAERRGPGGQGRRAPRALSLLNLVLTRPSATHSSGVDIGGSRVATALVAVTRDLRVAAVEVYQGDESVLQRQSGPPPRPRLCGRRLLLTTLGASKVRRCSSCATASAP